MEKKWWEILTKPKSPEKDPSVGINLAKQDKILENTADIYATDTHEALVKENNLKMGEQKKKELITKDEDDIRTPKDDDILNETFERGNKEQE